VKSTSLFWAISVCLTCWYLLAFALRRAILPFPHEVMLCFLYELQGELGIHVLWSLWRVLLSIALALITAVPFGIALGQLNRLRKLCEPFLYLLYPIPKVVFVPLLILFFGIGEIPKVLTIYLVLFFQIAVLVRDRTSEIRPELILSVKSLGAGRRALFRFVYLPAALPAIFTAIRQSTGTAIAVLYLAELFATRYGLGYYIYLTGSTLLDYRAMYAGIMAMSLLGLGIYYALDPIERKVCPWNFLKLTE